MPKMGSMGEFLAPKSTFSPPLNQLVAFSKIIPNDRHLNLGHFWAQNSFL